MRHFERTNVATHRRNFYLQKECNHLEDCSFQIELYLFILEKMLQGLPCEYDVIVIGTGIEKKLRVIFV